MWSKRRKSEVDESDSINQIPGMGAAYISRLQLQGSLKQATTPHFKWCCLQGCDLNRRNHHWPVRRTGAHP